jgi:hypothetical protein
LFSLNPLIARIANTQVEFMSNGLLDMLLTPKEVQREKRAEGRDIAATGLKTIIATAPEELGPVLIRQCTQRLLASLNKEARGSEQENREIQNEKHHSVDVLNELVSRFGRGMTADQDAIEKAVMPLLFSPQPHPRKRAITCLGMCFVTDPRAHADTTRTR